MIKKQEETPWRDTFPQGDTNYMARILTPIPLPIISDHRHTIDISKRGASETEFLFIPISGEIVFPELTYPMGIENDSIADILKKTIKANRGNATYVVLGFSNDASAPFSIGESEDDNVRHYGILCEVTRLIDASSEGQDMPAVIVTAITRVAIAQLEERNGIFWAQINKAADTLPRTRKSKEFVALLQTIQELTIEYIQQSIQEYPSGMLETIRESSSARFIINFSCAILPLRPHVKYSLLEITELKKRAEKSLSYMQEALSMQNLKNKIRSKTQEELDKQQKEYFLNQQIRMIQQELGNEDGGNGDIKELEEKAKTKKWSKKVEETFHKELEKLEHLNPQSPDYSIQYQYLQTLLDLPWEEYTTDEIDLLKAEKILDEDHCGLEKVKERIVEYLAVLKLRKDMKSPILCLWGPPGVGKTSLGKSVARALGRKYVRLSLGGLHDEAEIRGHRRTYIGAMPGRILQSIKKAGTSNPVIVLDEIDKVSNDYKGDPASALLEVLDPEQNKAFHDNYVDIDYDLSNVFFIATANTLSTISTPLLDRMELIEMSGYIEEEKVEIAQKHLIPRQLEEHGLPAKRLSFSPAVLRFVIEGYTRESGVRRLEKQIASICRKVARQVAAENFKSSKRSITQKDVESFLGPKRFDDEKHNGKRYYGVVTGLAWTSVGGEILYIETSIQKGKDGQLILTGNLGNVMKESATIALDYIRAHTAELGLTDDIFSHKALHVHVPEGAIPKDGPSAGITMVTSMLSALSKRYVKPRIAMTGEMTLRGKVLPVGGVKEKILAAKRMGITDIILSEENKKDISQIKEIYIKGLTFHYVSDIMEVVELALEPAPKTSQQPLQKKTLEKSIGNDQSQNTVNS